MIDAELCFVGLDVASGEAAVRALARELFRARRVKSTFEMAAIMREKRSPTGLPFAGGAIALPHADPEYVISPAIAIATLAHPVKFREMGNPATELDVSLVVMPALTAKDQAAAGLARILTFLQDDALREELRRAATPAALHEAFSRRWTDE